MLLLLSVGTCMLGYKLGTESGRKQTLDDLARRIRLGFEKNSEFYYKYGIRGTFLVLDYMGEDAPLGTGYSSAGPSLDFVVVHREDLPSIGPKLNSHILDNFDDDASQEDASQASNDRGITIVRTEVPVDSRLFKPSDKLSEIVGAAPLTRSEVLKKLWEYIQMHRLQAPESGRMIKCDDRLKAVVEVEDTTPFALTAQINKHLTSIPSRDHKSP